MLTIPDPLDAGDDGSTPPLVSAALAAYQAGAAGPERVLNALGESRLLVPVVALLTSSEIGAHGVRQEKESEMALPKLVGKDGREAVLAFTGTEPLRLWRPDARPIQATTLQVCRAAAAEGAAAVVVDVAGPVQFVIEGEVLRALAAIESGTLDGLTVARPEPVRKRGWFARKVARGR
ncbi:MULTISPECIES: SseB family protein [Nonomuraea]|uniref:SseB family protein n=2 Tax=Nonomuraea TaxID=83681 RepID=A0ABW1BNB7_9ACTN|nr:MULTISPECIES: SseB family protein [Nonomuraea]MDA0639388.1 SseB family protein [Nonomuraea ferruginea]